MEKRRLGRRLAAGAMCIFLAFQGAALPVRALSARAYALVEETSGRVIASSNGDARLPMASTTKIMTALLAVESGKLGETVTVPEEALAVEGSSMGLKAGEKLTVRDLAYGLLLESGNDAANTIALALSGSIPAFAARMNERAQALGLQNTHFCNPSGLDAAGHYTSAVDLARLAAAAMQNPAFAQIAATRSIRIPYDGIANGRLLVNHNRLLLSYAGAIGVKTGFTKKSGRCLVSCATRSGVTLVAVTLSDPNDWKDHEELLNSGFARLKSTPLLEAAPPLQARVEGGMADTVRVACSGGLSAPLAAGELARVKLSVQLERFYYAPVAQGQKLGQLVFTLDGVVLLRRDLIAAQSDPMPARAKNQSFFTRFWRSFRLLLGWL